MGRFLKLFALIFATMLGLVLLTEYEPGTFTSVAKVGGWPVVSIAQTDAKGLIAIGQGNIWGVLVLAQAGFGLVAVTQVGLGLIFGLGQLVGGLLIVGQVGVGLAFFLGQGGLSIQAIGQGVFRGRPHEYFSELSDELDELLRFRG